MKKVLILTVTAGGGHNACAYAMKNLLEASGDVQAEVKDIVNEYSTPVKKFVTDAGYRFAVARLPYLYKKFYDKYLRTDPTDRYKCPSQATALSLLDGLFNTIAEFKPDVIYCTHFYGAIAVTDLKLVCNLPCKCVATCLDFVNSPFWEAGIGVDYLAVPNEDFITQFLFEGLKGNNFCPLEYLRLARLKSLTKPLQGESLGWTKIASPRS